MTDTIELSYHKHHIRYENGLVNVTDLWKAAGEPEGKHDPRRWKAKAGQQFITAVADKLNVSSGDIYKTTRGKHGGSWAHWQIALAYAKYLSHDLHMHVNEVYMRYQTGDVTLADEVADKATPEEQERLAKRIAGKVVRNAFTHTLSTHGVTQSKDYATCTNAIYTPLFGGTAKQIRKQKNLPKKANVRDSMSVDELVAVSFAELASKKRIERNHDYGVRKCSKSCTVMSEKVAALLN